MSNPSLAVGQKIELNDGRVATVRFLGATNFQVGEWVGVELEEATGKNDGSVKGDRYFECRQGYGMFLRASGVKQVLERPKPKVSAAGIAGAAGAAKSRPSGVAGAAGVNGLKRQSVVDGKRTSTIGGGSTATAHGSRASVSGIRSPVKSPTKQLGSNGVSSSSTSRTSTPPVGRKPPTTTTTTAAKRQSLTGPGAAASRRTSTLPSTSGSATQRTSRSSLAPPSTGSRAPPAKAAPSARAPATRQPAAPSTAHSRLSSTTEEAADQSENARPDTHSSRESEADESSAASRDETEAEDEDEEENDNTVTNFAPPAPPPVDPPKSPQGTRSRRPSSPAAASVHSQRTIRSTAASNRQIEDLEAKLRLLERKRQEDRELRKSMEQAQQERDQYKGIIEKLQNKYRPQQQELADLKQALSDSEKKYAEIEATQAEHDSVVEMATLDREMAEETAEGLKAELDALRTHNEEVELELEILREENGELTKEMSPEERESAGWTQMQMSNDRLRNALLALRDRSSDEREELNEQIQSLEEQIKDLESIKIHYEETKERLLRSEADTGDLRQQLEVAQQADEIIEELTERNERLDETMSDLRATIADLEDLKELNDELEINHVEAEKQMQEEIGFKDSLLLDRDRMAKQQQEALDDADYTITQFRQLVRQLQGDLGDMKASKQISESEAKELEGKSRAMIDLNMKLQTNAAKTQVKTIDLELRKLEAQEASEHLAIVQLFLPEAFHAERDSILALLRFKRIAFKANLVHGFVKERVASFGSRGRDEDVFAACDVLDKLVWISEMASRFVNSICGCSIEDFSKYESALYELEPVERALNSYVDGLRRDTFREKDIDQELQRSIAVMAHLASIHIKDDLSSHADELLMRTMCLQSQLESAATALQLGRSLVEKNISASNEEDEDEQGSASDLTIILNRADALATHVRSAKVIVGKTHRSLTDLLERSLTLEAGCNDGFDSTERITREVADFTRKAGEALQLLFGDEGRSDPFTPAEVTSAFSRIATGVFSLPAPEAGPLTALAGRLRDLTDKLAEVASLPTDLDNTVEFERQPAPWVARANELKATKLTNIDTEAELSRTLETLRGREAVIAEKETELEEQSVRIEMLEARMKDASKRSARIAELEKGVHRARDEEARLRRAMESLKTEKDRELERVRAELGSRAERATRRGTTSGAGSEGQDNGEGIDAGAMGALARLAMKSHEQKILSLESAVRWLKAENLRLRLPGPDAPLSAQQSLAWLHEPLMPSKSVREIRDENLRKEGGDVLKDLLRLATAPPTVDLSGLPTDNRLAWRPRKQSPRWKVEVGKEEWEGLKSWRRSVVNRGAKAAGGVRTEPYLVRRPAPPETVQVS